MSRRRNFIINQPRFDGLVAEHHGTLRDLGAKSSISPVMLSLLRRGYSGSPQIRERVARALGVAVDELWAEVPDFQAIARLRSRP
jgi:hypothetical protein